MVSSFLVATVSLLVFWACIQYRNLRRNITQAKQSGLPYVLSPLSRFGQIWHEGYQPFAYLKTDNVLVVSPSGNILWTCDPESIQQFSKRSHDFVKPVEMMGMLNLYGPTVTATEGEESRIYRKTAAPSFNDRTHASAWTESLKRSSSLLQGWEEMNAPIEQLNEHIARLTLQVISFVCFDRPMDLPSATGLKANPSGGHTMTYSEAISSMVANISTLFIVPPPVLQFSPLSAHKQAMTSYTEWQKYMEEMRDETSASLQASHSKNDLSLLESFMQAGQLPRVGSQSPPISPAAVLGNIFVFIMAGYETSANTLLYAITLLACRPDFQRHLQADLDRILGDRPSSTWSYEHDFPKLLDGYVGAVINETLRLYTVLPFLPKSTKEKAQVFTSGGREYIVPPDTLILMDTSAVHRNPKHWPEVVPRGEDGPPFPVSSFDPARWLRNSDDGSAYNPVAGSYIPFSDGPRVCMGKRFAQAQLCAVLATVYKHHSIEVAVKDDERRYQERWQEAREMADKELSTNVGFLMSLKMKGKVPLQLVPRKK
ncbi:MAG: hypothetical protein LQ348_001825 [Seirophora lacunosa]|nr:MAG: hypothetical protein LQ348_001825 [Seirophora lacunosa]